MKLSWLGHSCFAIESGGYKIILDPFEKVRGYSDIKAEANGVYASHGHFDHAYFSGVNINLKPGNPFKITEFSSFHDDKNGSLRGENTIRLFEAEGIRLMHLGDLGHELSEKQYEKMQGADIVMIPVGGTYTIGPETARKVALGLRPGLIIPMHYRLGSYGFPELSELSDFLSLFPPDEISYAEGSEIILEKPLKTGVLVLNEP